MIQRNGPKSCRCLRWSSAARREVVDIYGNLVQGVALNVKPYLQQSCAVGGPVGLPGARWGSLGLDGDLLDGLGPSRAIDGEHAQGIEIVSLCS